MSLSPIEPAVDGASKPTALAVNPDGIPDGLRREPRWILWRYERPAKNGKWQKIPKRVGGGNASSTNRRTWTTFDEALAAYQAGGFDGLGFALGDGFAGVDLDDMRDPATGDLDAEAQFAIRTLDTYCEVSPSETGFKLFLRGTLPEGRKQRTFGDGRQVEMYDRGRYFCVTGHRLADAPAEVRERQSDLERVHRELVAVDTEPRESPASTPTRNAGAPARPAAADDRQRAIDALARLSPARADAYHSWIDVGMALHAVCPTLVDEWDRWSRASRKYRDGDCAAKWQSFGGGGGLTLGSLIHWARMDDPGGESPADALGWLRRVLRLPDLSGIVRRGDTYELARGDGEPIIIGTAAALLRQTTVRAALLGATGQYVAVDRREWPRVAETIARRAVVVETITDADLLRGYLRGYLARCESRMTGDPWEWLAECDRPGRGCWRDEDGRTWLHLPPLLAHLASAECGSRATAAEVCALLTRDGWERQQLYRVRDGARRGRRMWRGPSDLAQRLEDA